MILILKYPIKKLQNEKNLGEFVLHRYKYFLSFSLDAVLWSAASINFCKGTYSFVYYVLLCSIYPILCQMLGLGIL